MGKNERGYDIARVQNYLSEKRLASYLRESNETETKALQLYEWSAEMAASLFELVGHAEVILRNAIDQQMTQSLEEEDRGIPWFLLNLPVQPEIRKEALSYEFSANRDSVLANLMMGYWSRLVADKKLWSYLRGAFPNEQDHARIIEYVKQLHEIRNKLAHHAPMLDVDVPAHVENVMRLVRAIDSDCAEWLISIERATATFSNIPVTTPDTLLIPAGKAWPAYSDKNIPAYICQAGRFFRPVRRIAFYYDKAIQTEVPMILEHRHDVPWTEEYADKLASSSSELDTMLADVIRRSRKLDWSRDLYQVFLLTSSKGNPDRTHVHLAHRITHNREGRGSAFVHAQRYFHISDLRRARFTSDLPRSYFYDYPMEPTEDNS